MEFDEWMEFINITVNVFIIFLIYCNINMIDTFMNIITNYIIHNNNFTTTTVSLLWHY